MRVLKLSLLYLASLGMDFLGFGIVLLMHFLWGENLRWSRGILSTVLKPESYPLGGKKLSSGKLMRWDGFLLGFMLSNRKAALRGEVPIPLAALCFGHAHVYTSHIYRSDEYAGIQTGVETHEIQHTLWLESVAVFDLVAILALFVADRSLGTSIVSVLLYVFGPYTFSLVCNFTAYLRGKPAYRGSVFEEAAYDRQAVTRTRSSEK